MPAEERTKTASGQKGWRLSLSWPMMLLAGWAVYELTAQPGLAVLVTCIKFGWPDLRAAWWLRRVDPDRRRGQTCLWSYMAFGLWKVAIMAGIFLFSLVPCQAFLMRGQGRQLGMEILVGSFLTGAIGLGSSFLVTYLALFTVLRNGIRIWMGYAPRRARCERFWPPCHGAVNWAPPVFVTALIISFLLVMAGVFLLFSLFIEWGMPPYVAVLCFGGALLISIVCLTASCIMLIRRLFANSPQECWTSTRDEEVYQLDLPASSEDRG